MSNDDFDWWKIEEAQDKLDSLGGLRKERAKLHDQIRAVCKINDTLRDANTALRRWMIGSQVVIGLLIGSTAYSVWEMYTRPKITPAKPDIPQEKNGIIEERIAAIDATLEEVFMNPALTKELLIEKQRWQMLAGEYLEALGTVNLVLREHPEEAVALAARGHVLMELAESDPQVPREFYHLAEGDLTSAITYMKIDGVASEELSPYERFNLLYNILSDRWEVRKARGDLRGALDDLYEMRRLLEEEMKRPRSSYDFQIDKGKHVLVEEDIANLEKQLK